jgi:hypothetical protein
MPVDGRIERTDTGHTVLLEFESFVARLDVDIRSAAHAVITVNLIAAEGDEAVTYNFFPGVAADDDLKVDESKSVLEFRNVFIQTNRPVSVQRNFRTLNPYSMQRNVTVKPVRAFAALHRYQPLVLDIRIAD